MLDDLKDDLEDICDDADARPKMFKGSICDRLNVGDELPGKPERGSEKPDHCGDAGVTDGVSGILRFSRFKNLQQDITLGFYIRTWTLNQLAWFVLAKVAVAETVCTQ